MKLNDGKGIKAPYWTVNEELKSSDINVVHTASYKNIIDHLISLLGPSTGDSSDPDIIVGDGLRLTWSAGLAADLSPGIALSFTGAYFTSEVWGFVESSGDVFGVVIPEKDSVAVDEGDASDRYDTIEIRPIQDTYDPQTRKFKDPETGVITESSVDTKVSYSHEIQVLKGTPGAGVAPDHTSGWIKIAEIYVPALATELSQSNYFGCDESNLWTAEEDTTIRKRFSLRSMLDFPNDYTGEANKIIRVNNTETSMEFGDVTEDELIFNLQTRRQKHTIANGGFWGEVVWKSSTQVIILPKYDSGESWTGVVLNNGKYLELTSAYTISTAIQGEGGLLNGNSTAFTSSWHTIIGFEGSDGNLKFGFSWMPATTHSNANPTTTLNLGQIDSTNIGYLFNLNAHIIVFQDGDEWETPFAWQNGGAITYDPSKDKPKIYSKTTASLTLVNNLENTDFTSGSRVYQIDNFIPLDISDGEITDYIGTKGWKDVGIRIYTHTSSEILQFLINNNKFYFINGSGSADYGVAGWGEFNITTAWSVYNPTFIPIDKNGIFACRVAQTLVGSRYLSAYFTTYGELLQQGYGGTNPTIVEFNVSKMIHQLIKMKGSSGDSWTCVRGYIIK